MADKEQDDGKKPEKAPRPPKGEQAPKGDKGQQAKGDGGKGDKPERVPKGERAPKGERPAEKEKTPREPEERVTPRLRTQFDEVIRKKMVEQFGYKNPMQVPRVDKIVLNMGIGEGVADRKKVEQAAEALTAIVGQKAVITKSRKSIATYKLRDRSEERRVGKEWRTRWRTTG